MNEREWPTYSNWLSRPQEILGVFDRHFEREACRFRWGKLNYVGVRKG
jgi:hypothetical protein